LIFCNITVHSYTVLRKKWSIISFNPFRVAVTLSSETPDFIRGYEHYSPLGYCAIVSNFYNKLSFTNTSQWCSATRSIIIPGIISCHSPHQMNVSHRCRIIQDGLFVIEFPGEVRIKTNSTNDPASK
jgi:hypothetical protein